MSQTQEKKQTLYTYHPSFEDSIKYTERVKQLSSENWVDWVIGMISHEPTTNPVGIVGA
ncbi:hypothetical protein [Crocosphaera chwakensis]|uniref:Uncharacterized protein n=1 Tax=Crocosphaera chwakensis CCY0110 TaxID=391612 RepID=A3IY23_9CHRO|nr:hypothetical protein [Crocosphaera chwakensis]EAZ88599.1 hypothetical protein CY0110_31380 [Crocosphaera chwakensis CCY0110]